jgi:hypothetical protein
VIAEVTEIEIGDMAETNETDTQRGITGTEETETDTGTDTTMAEEGEGVTTMIETIPDAVVEMTK